MAERCRVLLLLARGVLGLAWTWRSRRLPPSPLAAGRTPLRRRLRPRTPAACPICRQEQPSPASARPTRPAGRPWREVRSPRGAPKRIDTEGLACPKRTGQSAGVSDARVPALVGAGTRGKAERIQRFRCQACGATGSGRRNTPR